MASSSASDPARRWLLIEPYYGGSHRQLVDGIVEHVHPKATVWTLPARKWKWRMRGSALEFARRARDEAETLGSVDALFASSMLNLAELRGVAPRVLRELPAVLYFHENQLSYPVQHFDARDHHFTWTQVHSALAADLVLWNSAYNRDSFLHELASLARKMPPPQPRWVVGEIAARSRILPVPVDTAAIEAIACTLPARSGPAHFVWNHRWEYDKGPDVLLLAVQELVASGLPFEMSILGESFQEQPAEFAELKQLLGSRVRQWGYLESRADYLRCLATADVALSTARHEFQGLAILEAAAAGAVPLVPDGLAYREVWPESWRWASPAQLRERLLDRVRQVERWRSEDPAAIARRFGWRELGDAWAEVLA